MKFGLVYDFRNPPPPIGSARPLPGLYAAMLEQIQLAESWGYDDIWLTEHHFLDDGYLPSLLPMAAAVAARTSRVTIGTFVVLMPFHHPIRLAEDCAVVDNISNGRLLFGPGVGYRRGEFTTFGIDRRLRGSITEEAVEIMIKCWTEEQFSYHGKHFHFDDVRCTPKPAQKPRIPVWFGATQGDALRRAARLGDGLLHTVAAPPDAPRQFAELLKEFGKDWRHPHVTSMALLFTSDDPQRDWERLKPHALYHLQGYARWYAEDQAWQQGSPPSAFGGQFPTDYADLERTGHYLVGTPDQIVARVKEIYAIAPFERFLYAPIWPGVDPDLAARSVRLFADKVIPALHDLDQ